MSYRNPLSDQHTRGWISSDCGTDWNHIRRASLVLVARSITVVIEIYHYYPSLLRSGSEVKITKGNIAIVIIVEHRNIGTTLTSIREDLPNAMVIIVNLPSVSNMPVANRLYSRLKATQHILPKSSWINHITLSGTLRIYISLTTIPKAPKFSPISNIELLNHHMHPISYAVPGWNGVARPKSRCWVIYRPLIR